MKKTHAAIAPLEASVRADMTHRLNRASGQIQAITRMVAEPDKYGCRDVVSQIKAARSALRKVSELYIAAQVEKCAELPEPERSANIKEALRALAVD